MSRKVIWFTSFVLSLLVWFGFHAWKPYFFAQMLSRYSLLERPFDESVTWEPAVLISLLLIGFAFLLFSNILHALFYQRGLPGKHKGNQSPILPPYEQSNRLSRPGDIDTDDGRIREQLLRRANRIDRKDRE